ncbi:RNA polymerase factor sigma-54 [Caballeronia sp. LZ065]|uniref:RNA polymerase factor sigma-54 n=1 Tax=Caballeronia sp. LZ065 TaxID=3038571 RepID=UPI00286040CF|nr:RNA polymerase factor sigma-54 [Caballeronia sp. LZ065]MDR5778874.1 RNA polymerase factor sigma-54 [Caballeronia sp. LZ065]
MPPILELRAKQSLALTPRLQQSVRLLQLSSLEFQQELRNALDTNPFLEYDETQTEDNALGADNGNSMSDSTLSTPTDSASEGPSSTESSSESEASVDAGSRDDSMNDYSSDPFGRSGSRNNGDGEGSDPADWVRIEPSLHETLHDSLRMYQLSERDRAIAQLIIEALDDDGYLRQELSDLANVVEIEPALGEDELTIALKLVQSLDRPGVGARNLSECLTLQLAALDEDTPGRAVALEIVVHHLERLARREQAELQKKIGCSADELRTACALVRRLDPKPGENYGQSEDNYVVPDVIVRPVKKQWLVTINPAVLPRARIHRMYAELFAQSAGASRSPLAQQLQEARWLIRNAQQRFTTIQRVAECIVSHQKAFFDYGEIALKPLVLRDVADELGLHESTISRATGNKYMSTPRGIFEFKHFFPRELSTESGGTCSAAAVRALLKEMISQENTRDPLSDVSLAKMLADQGVIVARRTVAKYRHLMKVPPAELRRQA